MASRSAIASDSSAKAGSKALRGNAASASAPRAESRKDDREDGRSGVVGRRGVVGREVRLRELGRLSLESCIGVDIAII